MTALLVGVLVATASGAAARSPAFEDYPASARAPATLAKADLKSHPRPHEFRTIIQRADAEPANFAGYRTATRIGCGTSCAFLVVVDRRTGRIEFFPSPGVLSWAGDDGKDDKYGFTFKVESRLLRACGAFNEVGHLKCSYYEWTDAGPKLLSEEKWGRRPTGR